MPFTAESPQAVGKVTEIFVSLPWAMQFAAACQDASAPLTDNTSERGDSGVLVHPVFLPATVGVSNTFKCLKAAGLSKNEFLSFPFLHHTCDVRFNEILHAASTVYSHPKIASMEQSQKGLRISTRTAHKNAKGVVCAVEHFGGVLVGYKIDKRLGEQLASNSRVKTVPFRPSRIVDISFTHEIQICFGPESAHIFNACIQNPMEPHSSSLNPHINLALAKRSGLPGRTMNGLGMLGVVISQLVKNKTQDYMQFENVSRLGCVFRQPVYLHYEPVKLRVRFTGLPKDSAKLIRFVVEDTESGKQVIGDGYVDFALGSAVSQL